MKIICVGRNYAAHARELANDVPTSPVLFLKPQTAVLPAGKDLYYPEFTKDLHYECELVLRICRNGKHIQEKFAHKYYDAATLGIDFTARDVQEQQKQKGLPWEIAKAFDNSAVVGNFHDVSNFPGTQDIHFELLHNGNTVQRGHTADMIFSVDKIIAYASQFFSLNKGDLIFTGTPAGVGPVKPGDTLQGMLQGIEVFSTSVK